MILCSYIISKRFQTERLKFNIWLRVSITFNTISTSASKHTGNVKSGQT